MSDHGSVIVALPTIADHFGTDLPTTQWVLIGYALTISALLLPMGRLADLVGRKRVYLTGFALFVVGAVLAGLAPSMLTLILTRVLMGVGAAMTQGTSTAMIVSAFPESERGKALGLQLSAVGSGAVVGPAMGGLIVSALGWQAVFFTTALLGLIAIAAALVVLQARRTGELESEGPRVDWLGAALASLALIVFLLATTNGSTMGWGSPAIVAAFAGLSVLLAAFAWWELRAQSPMLDVRLFRRGLFSAGVAARFISFLGMSSIRFLMPFYLQAVAGLTPRQMGLLLVPSALTMIGTGPLGGRLSDRYGWRTFSVGGLAISAVGLLALSRIGLHTPLMLIVAAMVVQTVGAGMFGAPNSSSILSAVEPSRYEVISGFLNLVRNSANVTGTALATAIVTAVMASQGFAPSLTEVSASGETGVLPAFTSGVRVAYLATGIMVLVGALVSSFNGGKAVEGLPAQVEKPPRRARMV